MKEKKEEEYNVERKRRNKEKKIWIRQKKKTRKEGKKEGRKEGSYNI